MQQEIRKKPPPSRWESVCVQAEVSRRASGLSPVRFVSGEHASVAYVNASEKRDMTDSYKALCQHYRMCPTTNNLGVSHENGAIETAHGSLKHRIDQALKLRGSSDFTNVAFVFRIVEKLNKRSRVRFTEEQAVLQPLPQERIIDYREQSVRVTSISTNAVTRTLYSVP